MARYMTKREAMRKRAWFRALSGLADFFASIGSVIVILLCVALLTQLFVWLRGDITQVLFSLESVAVSAIVSPDAAKEKESVDILPAAPTLPQATPAPVDGAIVNADGEPDSAQQDEAGSDDPGEADSSENDDQDEDYG